MMINDIIKYILNKTGKLPIYKLHKLLYYCQAWSLVWDKKSLFRDRIEAWCGGPIVVSFYKQTEGIFVVSKWKGDSRKLSREQKETINAVLDCYGDKDSQWLVDLSRNEDPYKITRKGMPESERGHRKITNKIMRDYYRSLC